MNIIGKLRKTYLFSSLIPEKYGLEKTQVSFDKLERWLDVQFRPHFKTTTEQLKTNLSSLQDLVVPLENGISQLQSADFTQAKIHIRKLSEDHRQLLAQALQDLVIHCRQEPIDITPIRDFYEDLGSKHASIVQILSRSESTIGALCPELFSSFNSLMGQIKQNQMQALDIFDQSTNGTFGPIRQIVREILKKRAGQAAIHQEISALRREIELVDKDMARITGRIQTIEEDPRYQSEKTSVQKSESRFRHSFYELDLLDLQSKQKQLEHRKSDILDEITHKEQEIARSGIDADIHLFKDKIKKQLLIQVDLVEPTASADDSVK